MNKQNTNSSKDFSAREVGVLLESMDKNIKLIAEQHGGIVGRLDTIDGRLDTIDGRLDTIDGRLDKIDTRLKDHTEMIGKLAVDMTIVKEELTHKVGSRFTSS